MAPIRRYLRITKYSVLECRIYLDNPALAESWLLNPRNPVLPRIIESVRPLVLPKLREENERSKGKGSKKKGVKDVVVEGIDALHSSNILLLTNKEDFEISIFLTETSTRHSLLTKLKHFKDPKKKSLQSNSSRLTGDTVDAPVEIGDGPVIRSEDSDEEPVNLDELSDVEDDVSHSDADALFVSGDEATRRSKRPRATTNSDSIEPPTKRTKDKNTELDEPSDDKKKLAMDTSYDGFSIYGRVLCLVVKRKDRKGKGPAGSSSVGQGQATMESWITSTQMPPEDIEDS